MCAFEGCGTRDSFGFGANAAAGGAGELWFCQAHRLQGSKQRCGSAPCAHLEGCANTASFGNGTTFEGSSADGGKGDAPLVGQAEAVLAGGRTGKKLFCATHKRDGQVNVRRKLCESEGCPKYANFCDDTTMQRRFCGKHKKANSTTWVRYRPACGADGCARQPTFGNETRRVRERCAAHRFIGDVYLMGGHRRCEVPECHLACIFGLPSEGVPTRCGKHRTPGQAAVQYPVCRTPACLRRAVYGPLTPPAVSEGAASLRAAKKGATDASHCEKPRQSADECAAAASGPAADAGGDAPVSGGGSASTGQGGVSAGGGGGADGGGKSDGGGGADGVGGAGEKRDRCRGEVAQGQRGAAGKGPEPVVCFLHRETGYVHLGRICQAKVQAYPYLTQSIH